MNEIRETAMRILAEREEEIHEGLLDGKPWFLRVYELATRERELLCA